jgi:hypothetical protein
LKAHNIDAVLPTMGGQTALNLCIECNEIGLWSEFGVQIIGVQIDAIDITENRERFRELMEKIGVPMAPQATAKSFLEGKEVAQEFGFPICIRPSFTLGGAGASIVHNSENFSDTRAEKNMRTVVRIVKDLKRPQATREFIKPKAQFGFTKKVTLPIKRFLGIKDNSHTAVFWKFYPYRTWQTWNQLLYCKVRQNMIGDDDDKKLGCDKYYMDYKTLCTPAKLKDIADNLCKACKRKGECCNDHCFRRALACRLTELAVEGYDKKEDGLTRMVSIIGKGVNDAVDNAKNAVGNLADSLDETAGRMSPSWSTDRNGTTVVESPIRRKETLGGKFARALSSKKKDRSGIDHNPYEDALTATCKEEYKHPKDFKNFDTFADCTPVEDFLKEVVNTFVLVTMYKSVKHAWRVNNKWRLLTLLFDWMLRWMVWFISLVVFPIVVVGVIGGLPFFCMDHEEVINAVVNTVQQ